MATLGYRAANAAVWSALELLARYCLHFMVVIVVARLIEPEHFGLIAICMIFAGVGALLVDSGLGTALIQRQKNNLDDETTVFVVTLMLGILLGILLALLAPPIASFFEQPALIPLIRAMAITLPANALAAVPDALLTMRLDFKSRAKAELFSSSCAGAMAIFLATRGYGVWSLVWQAVLMALLRSSLLWLYCGWRPTGKCNTRSFRVLFGFGGYMLLANLVSTLEAKLQSVVVGKLFDSRALGYFTLAQSTQSAPASFIGSVLTRVGLPVFSEIAHEPARLRETMASALRITMFIFFPCMVGMAVVAEPLVSLLYGNRWAPAAPILTALAMGAALWPIHVVNIAAISAQGRSDLLFRIQIIKHLMGVALTLLFARWGVVGVAWSVFACGALSALINAHYSKKFLGYGFSAQLRDQAATLLFTATSAWAATLSLQTIGSTATGMIIAISISALTYWIMALIFQNAVIRDIKKLIAAHRFAISTLRRSR